MTIYSTDIVLSQFWTSLCSMSSSDCCFLTCIQFSQETGFVVWYPHLFKNFPVCCDPHRGFSVVNEADVDGFLESPCIFCNSAHVGRLPTWCSGKESAANAGGTRDLSSIPRWGRSPGEETGNPLQYFCLGDPRDRGAWRAPVQGCRIGYGWACRQWMLATGSLVPLCFLYPA